jgi:hypothetical protein
MINSEDKPRWPSQEQLAGLSVEHLERERSVVYVLDSGLRLRYCNRAWDEFAARNGGEGLEWDAPRGVCVLDVIADPIRSFYEKGFQSVAKTGLAWEHDFECSSKDLYRKFHMDVKFMEETGGFVVMNSLAVEEPHRADRRAMPEDPALYLTKDGMVKMCCHCRRTRRADGSEIWDWAPRNLEDPFGRVSHGLCPACIAYFYSDIYA